MNYEVTFFYGERDNEGTIKVYHVKKIAYDNGTVIFFGDDNEPLLIIHYQEYRIIRIP